MTKMPMLMAKRSNKVLNIFAAFSAGLSLLVFFVLPVHSSFTRQQQYTWQYKQTSSGEKLLGIELLQNSPVTEGKYNSLRTQYKQSGTKKKEYAGASLGMMINYTAKLQNKFANNLEWMTEGNRFYFLEETNKELSRLQTQLRVVEDSEGEDLADFSKISFEWETFRISLKNELDDRTYERVNEICDGLESESSITFSATSQRQELYTNFIASCEDWGREPDNLPSETLLEFIKTL